MVSAILIAKKEFLAFVRSPVIYWAAMTVAILVGFEFNDRLDLFRSAPASEALNFTESILSPLFSRAGVVLLLAVPFLTMNILSAERREGTLSLLLCAPLRSVSLVAGKYLALVLVVALLVGIVALFAPLLASMGTGADGGPAVEWPTVAGALLGLVLLGSTAAAIGLFASSLTDSAMIAALATLAVLVAFWALGGMAFSAQGEGQALLRYLAISSHFEAFVAGQIDLGDIVYFGSITFLALLLTERSVESHRWL
jgi:ABC-2 type transport system permease protein